MSLLSTKSLGDFQTPLPLVREVLAALGNQSWMRVLEPTCGRGNFIRGLLELNSLPHEIIGVELQPTYANEARAIKTDSCITILNADVFTLDFRHDLPWRNQGSLLVVGNPPWITNAAQGKLDSRNLPPKSNLRRQRGIEAITGHSNFDLGESIWMKLLDELAGERATIALLCKTSVARRVLQYAYHTQAGIASASIRRLDAKRWFGATVDACLFTLTLEQGARCYQAQVFDSLSAPAPCSRMGYFGTMFVADVANYREVAFLDGPCAHEWRQGIKHDAAAVMELVEEGNTWRNGLGEAVDVEPEYVYPLIKGAGLQSNRPPRRRVLIPQTRVGQDTRLLEHRAPHLWRYLTQHIAILTGRKSAIYRNQPPFSIFGVGRYAFAPYKVLVSGLHKHPHFAALHPHNGKPVMCDDTCYLLPFDTEHEAEHVAAALNHPLAQRFIASITFPDSKRPITKAALRRINLGTLLQAITSVE